MTDRQRAPESYRRRSYRRHMHRPGLTGYRVAWGETDLHVQTPTNRAETVLRLIQRHRDPIERYIAAHPQFATTLVPWPDPSPVPVIVGRMMAAARRVDVGPMAAVAGAIAEAVGRDLLAEDDEVIVENGGDLFFRCSEPITVGLFAGGSALSGRIGWRITACRPMALCTSSGTVGHSTSFGRADAVAVLSENGALADAAATAIGNRVHHSEDIQAAIDRARTVAGILGILVIVGDTIGAWGQVDLVDLTGKKS